VGAARPGLTAGIDVLFRRVEDVVLGRLPTAVAARVRSRVRARPTREGAWFLLLVLAVVLAALNTGNNLLYMVLGSLLGTLVLNNILAEWNLRGLRVERRLPDEAWAERAAAGTLVLRNGRRFGAAWSVRIHEGTAEEPFATGHALRVGPGESLEVPIRWTFAWRGEIRLESLVLESTFPFGLMRRWRSLPASAALLVFPRPEPGLAPRRAAGSGRARLHETRVGTGGDFHGLRPYVPGDPLRSLHWPTTARTGRPMVVVRTREVSDEVVVEVPERSGAAWERSLSRAAGQVQHHAGAGHAVGLRLAGQVLPPRTGDAWRRHLLGLLARAPRREAP